MPDRLSGADVSFLRAERANLPQHVGGLSVFRAPADGFDYDRLIRLIEERIALVPRYRQKLRFPPAGFGAPSWVDDPDFDLAYHVRRSALARPGDEQALLDLSARILFRLLDRGRPLWELYLVEGLADGRFAVLTKTHEAMVDGVGAVDIEQVLLDASPRPRRTVRAARTSTPQPRRAAPACDVLAAATRPVHTAAAVLRSAAALAGAALGAVGGLGAAVVTAGRERPGSTLPLVSRPGQQRRLAIVRTRLSDYRQVRDSQGGTVNDVALATVAGALRAWLVGRGAGPRPNESVRALVPVTIGAPPGRRPDPRTGGDVSALLVDLPVGEPDPLRRLAQIRYAMAVHHASGRSVRADVLAGLSGFAPPTLHALGSRAASGLHRNLFALVVTNVPGTQQPMYAAGAQMLEMFPVVPLPTGQALSVGITSYDGQLLFGINADRDDVPDVGVFAGGVRDSLAELVAAAAPAVEVRRGARRRRSAR